MPPLVSARPSRALKPKQYLDKRSLLVLHMVWDAGRRGLTDDEIDARTRWGHQSTTPITSHLRRRGYLCFCTGNANGTYITRPTRLGRPAKVNLFTPKALSLLTKRLA